MTSSSWLLLTGNAVVVSIQTVPIARVAAVERSRSCRFSLLTVGVVNLSLPLVSPTHERLNLLRRRGLSLFCRWLLRLRFVLRRLLSCLILRLQFLLRLLLGRLCLCLTFLLRLLLGRFFFCGRLCSRRSRGRRLSFRHIIADL
ncbi:Uncharacterised protein [Actinomyces bovis]|uniref:Uncharacterized protein n=1 Tax=Actinomyces bovis TaxID=1658 RepID=A0ABY1VP25_9ACTO|nr:Uncharacterised protein [Actinomyces bovis]VEG53282.1 Uncharacterised protein [Actinomyces israelii]